MFHETSVPTFLIGFFLLAFFIVFAFMQGAVNDMRTMMICVHVAKVPSNCTVPFHDMYLTAQDKY